MALQKSTERDNTLDMVLVFMMPKIGSKIPTNFHWFKNNKFDPFTSYWSSGQNG